MLVLLVVVPCFDITVLLGNLSSLLTFSHFWGIPRHFFQVFYSKGGYFGYRVVFGRLSVAVLGIRTLIIVKKRIQIRIKVKSRKMWRLTMEPWRLILESWILTIGVTQKAPDLGSWSATLPPRPKKCPCHPSFRPYPTHWGNRKVKKQGSVFCSLLS